MYASYLIRRIEVILVFLSGSTSYQHFIYIPENRVINEFLSFYISKTNSKLQD